MNIFIVSGSHRPQGQSGRIARVIEQQIQGMGHQTSLLDLATVEIPSWDEAFWGNAELQPKWDKLWSPWAEKLKAADALIVLAPEYHGMLSSRLKNFLLLTSENGKPLAHKPGLIVAVSGGINGAYPVAEIRATGGKNSRIVWVPDHLIIRSAGSMLVDEPKPENKEHDATLRDRLTDSLNFLLEYAKALKPIQQMAGPFLAKFPNGM